MFTQTIGVGGGAFEYEYDGDWKDDVREGTGKLKVDVKEGSLPTSQKVQFSYEGEWKNGLPHGSGTLRNTDGTRYEGMLREGGPHGYGILCNKPGPQQCCIAIDFKNATAVGDGTAICERKQYAVTCGGEESDCRLVSKTTTAEDRDELKFDDLMELQGMVLPRALAANLVLPLGKGEDGNKHGGAASTANQARQEL